MTTSAVAGEHFRCRRGTLPVLLSVGRPLVFASCPGSRWETVREPLGPGRRGGEGSGAERRRAAMGAEAAERRSAQ